MVMTVFIGTTQEDIDIEMGGSEETSESPKKGPSTLRQNLQILLHRQAKFIESCREVKVRSSLSLHCVISLTASAACVYHAIESYVVCRQRSILLLSVSSVISTHS